MRKLNPEAPVFIPPPSMVDALHSRIDGYIGSEAEYIHYLENLIRVQRAQVTKSVNTTTNSADRMRGFHDTRSTPSHNRNIRPPFVKPCSELLEDVYGVVNVREKRLIGGLIPEKKEEEEEAKYGGESNEHERPRGPWIFHSQTGEWPTEDGDECYVFDQTAEIVGVLLLAKDRAVNAVDMVRGVDRNTDQEGPPMFIDHAESRARRGEACDCAAKDALPFLEILDFYRSCVPPEHIDRPFDLLSTGPRREVKTWFVHNLEGLVGLVQQHPLVNRGAIDHVTVGDNTVLGPDGRGFFLKWLKYPSLMHNELLVVDLDNEEEIGKLVKDEEKAAKRPKGWGECPTWEIEEQGPWRFVERIKGEPGEDRSFNPRCPMNHFPPIAAVDCISQPIMYTGGYSFSNVCYCPFPEPVTLRSIADSTPRQVLSVILRSRKINIINVITRKRYLHSVPKQMLIHFCGSSIIFRWLRNVGNQQELGVPNDQFGKLGLKNVIRYMQTMCRSPDLASAYIRNCGLESILAGIETIRACRFLGLHADAMNIEICLLEERLGRQVLTADDVRLVWNSKFAKILMGPRTTSLRNTPYTDAIVYNLLHAQSESFSAEIALLLDEPNFRDLKQQFDWEIAGERWKFECIRGFLNRATQERLEGYASVFGRPTHALPHHFCSARPCSYRVFLNSIDSPVTGSDFSDDISPSSSEADSSDSRSVTENRSPISQRSISHAQPITMPLTTSSTPMNGTRSPDSSSSPSSVSSQRQYHTQTLRRRHTH